MFKNASIILVFICLLSGCVDQRQVRTNSTNDMNNQQNYDFQTEISAEIETPTDSDDFVQVNDFEQVNNYANSPSTVNTSSFSKEHEGNQIVSDNEGNSVLQLKFQGGIQKNKIPVAAYTETRQLAHNQDLTPLNSLPRIKIVNGVAPYFITIENPSLYMNQIELISTDSTIRADLTHIKQSLISQSQYMGLSLYQYVFNYSSVQLYTKNSFIVGAFLPGTYNIQVIDSKGQLAKITVNASNAANNSDNYCLYEYKDANSPVFKKVAFHVNKTKLGGGISAGCASQYGIGCYANHIIIKRPLAHASHGKYCKISSGGRTITSRSMHSQISFNANSNLQVVFKLER
jgi:hypothetical protein